MELQAIRANGATDARGRVTFDNAGELHDVIAFLARHVMERRCSIPILQTVLIEPCEGGARLTATDLDILAGATVAAAWEVPEPMTVDAYLFADMLKQCDRNRPLSLDIVPDGRHARLAIACGRFRSKTGEMRLAEDFPLNIARMSDNPLSWEREARQLADDLALVSPAICREETRYYLNGICVDVIGGIMTMAATDGHRLSRVERPADGLPDHAGAIIPRKMVGIMRALLKASDGAASVDLGLTSCSFTIGRWRIRSKLIDGLFPDFRRVIPRGDTVQGRLTIATRELATHGKVAHAKESPALAMDLAPGACRAGKAGPEGYARPLSAEYEGAPMTIAANGAYLADYAKSHERLEFALIETGAPIAINDPDRPHWLGVLMPMRCDHALPDQAAVTYRAIEPAPGRAADLSGVERADGRGKERGNYDAMIGIAPGARAATLGEIKAYLTDYARRCGFPDLDCANYHLQGATFGDDLGDGEWSDGSYSVPMPGYRQAPVTVEYQDESGDWSAPALCTNAKGEIALPDQKKERAPRKGKGKAPAVDNGFADDGKPASCESPAGDGAPMFRTMADFIEAMQIGTHWHKAEMRDGQWRYVPIEMIRTVAKRQSREIGFAWGIRSAEEAARLGVDGKHNLSWLSFPKRGAWASDERGMILLDREGRPFMRFDPFHHTMPQIADSEPLQAQGDGEPIGDSQADEIALCEAQAAPVASVDVADATETETAPDLSTGAPDDLAARVDALTRLVASLSVEIAAMRQDAAPLSPLSVESEPAGEDPAPLPKDPRARVASHLRLVDDRMAAERMARERAKRLRMVRRYLAMRGEREALRMAADEARDLASHWERQARAADMATMRAADQRDNAKAAKRRLTQAAVKARAQCGDWKREADARGDLIALERADRDKAQADVKALAAELALLKRKLEDPTNPARPSDLIRLKDERDAARRKSAELEERARQASHIMTMTAEALEAMTSRAMRAEAALRERGRLAA